MYKLFQAKFRETTDDTVPAYLETSDKTVFKSFPDRHWVIVGEAFGKVSFEGGQTKLLPFVLPSTFGPPERAYGHQLSADYGAGVSKDKGAYFPWEAGTLYYKYGFEDHKRVLGDVLDYLLDGQYVVKTNAPQAVELFYNHVPVGNVGSAHMIQLLNLSGFNGVTYGDPIPVAGVKVTLPGVNEAYKAYSLKRQQAVPTSLSADGLTLTVDVLDLYDAIILKH